MVDLNALFKEIVGEPSTPGYDPWETLPVFYAEARKRTMNPEDWAALEENVWGMLFDYNCCDRDVLAFLDRTQISPALWKSLIRFRPEAADEDEWDDDVFDVEELRDEIRYNLMLADRFDTDRAFPPEERSARMFRDWETWEIISLAYYARDSISSFLIDNRIKLKDKDLKNLDPGDWSKLVWCNVDFIFHKYCPLDALDDEDVNWDDIAESFAVKHSDWREVNVKERQWKKIEAYCPDIRKSLAEQAAARDVEGSEE